MGNIAHASQDERKGIKGGLAGDQTGKELCVRSYYNRPWNVVIRAYSTKMREQIARFMEEAVQNDVIGYDQLERNSLHKELKKLNYHVKAVTAFCETDCSALVSDACISAGVPESTLYINSNLSTTSTLKSRLNASGLFEIITDLRVTGNEKKLCRGDILLYEGHHTAVYISGNLRPVLRKGDNCADVKVMRDKLNAFGVRLSSSTVFDTSAFNALVEFQGYKGIEKDGICGKDSWRYLEQY